MVCRVVLLLATAVSVAMSGCSSSSAPSATHATQSSAPQAERFLERYVTGDGRVVRHDQGGDIVSEGQAYGMLIAELAGRPDRVRAIWGWTKSHLQRSDGLLNFHATASGQVDGTQPAADADTLAAYALLRYTGPDAATLHKAGKRIAAAALDNETMPAGGAPALVAGPWARATQPPTVNPSYWMPSVFQALARFTGDDRWQQLASGAVHLIDKLTDGGRTLPTDWAQLDTDRLQSVASPDGGAPVQYGLDAARLPLWFGTACTDGARKLAAAWWHNALSEHDRATDIALAPNGSPINQDTHPLPPLAAAAAATAAGDEHAAAQLRQRAKQQAKQTPTYYGDAWLVLGSALLDGALDPCKEATHG